MLGSVMDKPEILIIGGTGNIGSELASIITGANIPIRILLRPESTANVPKHDCIEIVHGHLDEPDNIGHAFEGIEKVFLLTRDQPHQGEIEGRLVDLAVHAGVQKVVKSSAFAAGLDPPISYGVALARTEKKLMASGINWVILRPYMFMQNFLLIAELIMSRGILPLPLGQARVAFVDARDVALAAFRVLTTAKFDNQIFELTGPAALSLEECATILTNVLNRQVRYRSPPLWLAGLIMRIQGTSSWDVNMRKELFRMIREGGEDQVTNDVERTTGQSPRSLEKFVRDNIDAFRAPSAGPGPGTSTHRE
jgi:uncharacterized protein YbjT (DUF2867 family)